LSWPVGWLYDAQWAVLLFVVIPQTLGWQVDDDAAPEVIKVAYRALAKSCHPDFLGQRGAPLRCDHCRPHGDCSIMFPPVLQCTLRAFHA
jgi:hypothetical protein